MNKLSKSFCRFEKKVALVTGGASGMGRAAVSRLAEEGATIIVADRDTERGKMVITKLRKDGFSGFFQEVDLAEEESIKNMGVEISHKVKALHVLLNCAGIGSGGSIENTGEHDWTPLMAINLRAPALVTKAVLPLMKKEGGSIVNIASDGGLRGREGSWTYDASKAGLISLTKTMAVELIQYGIRVNAVAPGFTATRFYFSKDKEPEKSRNKMLTMKTNCNLMGRAAHPEELAAAIVFLASDEASYITGTTLCVDGGRVELQVTPDRFWFE
jgi:3-oxoacyl-[acyl-carrier protein] reductase